MGSSTMLKTILFSFLLGVCLADHHDDEFDFYDINSVFNQFYVSCGSPEDPYMRITYSGDAYSVYAAEEPELCKGEEVAPAVFLIDIKDYGNTDCPVANISTGDPDKEIDEAILGNYIQLRAYLANETDTENSIKIFNCRAFDDDLEYYFLIGGCGEGDVMPKNRGFRTGPEEVTAYTNVSRVARSTYFKIFLLPDKHHLTFECDYILCDADRCDGFSCSNSIMNGGAEADHDDHRRKKRAVDSYSHNIPASPAAPTGQMPAIRSKRVTILPQEDEYYRISANDLVHGGQANKQAPSPLGIPEHNTAGVLEVYVRKFVPQQNVYQQEAAPMPSEQEEEPEVGYMFGLDLVTIGLIGGMTVLALLIIVTLSCTVVLLKQQRPQAAGYHQSSMQGSPVYTGPPGYKA